MAATPVMIRLTHTLFALCLGLAAATSVQAATTIYAVTFDATTVNDSSGSFVWDDVSKTMTGFSWRFQEGTGTFSDAGLDRHDRTSAPDQGLKIPGRLDATVNRKKGPILKYRLAFYAG